MDRDNKINRAPGGPGISSRWSPGAKLGIGKAMQASSDVSFTIGQGILNEVYYPWEDEASIRDMEFLVSDGASFFSEEKSDTSHAVRMISAGIPVYVLSNICLRKRYKINKEIIADPIRNTIIQQVRFKAFKGNNSQYQLFILVTPRLGNQGAENTGWAGNYKGVPMLFARRNNRAMALACSFPFLKRSAGFVGTSDGWQDIYQHKKMEWEYGLAENGNVTLTGQIDLERTEGRFVLALGFGHNEYEAAYSARGSLLAGYKETRQKYATEWRNWQRRLASSRLPGGGRNKFFHISASVLRMHEANRVPGAIIGSMSIPWGENRGDEDTGGYHMVWPRDLVESSGGLLALHGREDPLRILTYLMTTQEEDGHWVQNMWLQGRPHWKGIQMDQTALPILLMDLFKTHHLLEGDKFHRYWITVKKALSFLVQHGPFTEQDRWERDSGLSIFTVASEIAALVAGAEFADENEEPEIAAYCRETADCWNAHIEEWFYVNGGAFADKYEVDGYYIRLNLEGASANELKDKNIRVFNHPENACEPPATEMISPDALALVRFGLQPANDIRIKNTLKMIDANLMVSTPGGPCWHRYSMDGYGEHKNGDAYDGTGIGRAWPLLTGERAHYEIAAENMSKALSLIKTMESFADNGLFPEQIWDSEDIPEKELFLGKRTGSAMPLVWAHAEYIKLCRSIKEKAVFDMPLGAQKRYVEENHPSSLEVWRSDHPITKLRSGKTLRIEGPEPMFLHWSSDNWLQVHDTPSIDTGLGIHYVDIPSVERNVTFTFLNKASGRWMNKNFEVGIR